MKAGKNTTIFFRLFYFAIFLTILIIILLINSPSPTPKTEKSHPPANDPVQNQFGFISDSLKMKTSVINKNQTLSDILFSYDLGKYTVAGLVNAASGVFNVRQLIPGKKYHIYSPVDTSASIEYFVYEKDPVNYVVFNIGDSISVYSGKKELSSRRRVKSSVINHSLYISLLEDDASPELAIKLSQIFAWQIDFYHIQKGDNFKVIYEELYVDSQFVGIGKIFGAYFQQSGKDYYAFPLVQDSIRQFFDENGNSLRKAFLKAPLEFGRISSRFSRSRLHPVLKVHRPHLGVDYAAPIGTPVRSTGDGTVTDAGYSGGNGRYVKIRHNSVYATMYLHLSKYGKGIKKGTLVKQGQIIGYVGSSGLSTGPHLDYRFFMNGKPVDPLKVELPPSVPVKDELIPEFQKVKAAVLNELKNYEFAEQEPEKLPTHY